MTVLQTAFDHPAPRIGLTRRRDENGRYRAVYDHPSNDGRTCRHMTSHHHKESALTAAIQLARTEHGLRALTREQVERRIADARATDGFMHP